MELFVVGPGWDMPTWYLCGNLVYSNNLSTCDSADAFDATEVSVDTWQQPEVPLLFHGFCNNFNPYFQHFTL